MILFVLVFMVITRTIKHSGDTITVGSTLIITIIIVAKITMTIAVILIDVTITVVESSFSK